MPQWQLDLLLESLPALQAERLIDLMTAAMTPYMERDDRWRMIRNLQRIARIDDEPEPIEVIEHNPEKAAEWLRQQGWQVNDTVSSA